MQEYCNFLQGVCVLQEAISSHVLNKELYNPELQDLLNSTGDVKIIPYDAPADETARTLITIQRGDVILGSKTSLSSNRTNTTFTPTLALYIKISTQSYYLTEKLGQELLQYLASIQNAIRAFNLNIGSLSLSPTVHDKSSSPNYFINTITLNCSVPLTTWKTKSSDDILSCIKTNITFNGQSILS